MDPARAWAGRGGARGHRGVYSFDYINSSWESSGERSAVINCGSFSLSQHGDSVFVFHYFPEAPSSWKTGLIHTCILVLN